MKSTKKLLTVTGFIFLFFTLCSISVNAQTLKDINGRVYKTSKVGMQEWTSENLNVDRFQNGDVIPQAQTSAEWEMAGKAGKPAWCYTINDTINGKVFGRFYNFYAVNDPRGLAPKGWHIPAVKDWTILVKILGGVDAAGTKLKNIVGWKQVVNNTNKSGFTAIPGGSRSANGAFKDINSKGQWWTASEDGVGVWSVGLNSYSIEVGYFKVNKETGLSVRCVKD
jgi:uncharacterized protein (TIGR02145 family)